MLFVRQHVNCEHQFSGEKCLDLESGQQSIRHKEIVAILTKTPRTTDVPSDNVVRTLNVVGKSTDTMYELKIAPQICAPTSKTARTTPTPWTMTIASVTAGLNLHHS